MEAARAFYQKWGARQHGLDAADPAAAAFSALWADLFATPYLQLGLSDNFFGSVMKRNVRDIALQVAAQGTVPKEPLANLRNAVLRLTNNTDASGATVVNATAALLARAEALASSIPARRLGFYRSHTLLQARLAAGGVALVVGTAQAASAAASGDWAGAGAAASAACAAGASVLAGFRDAEASSSPGVWGGWFAGDYLSDMQGAYDACRVLGAAVGAPGAKGALPPMETADLWYTWDFAWQGQEGVQSAYPLSQAVDPGVAFALQPRINCVFADVDAGLCAPNPSGGVWAGGRGGRITLQVMNSPTAGVSEGAAGGGGKGLSVRYTADGTPPTAASPAYAPGGIKLDDLAGGNSTVTVTAAVFDGDVQVGGAKATTWRRD